MYDLLWKKEKPLFRTFLLEYFPNCHFSYFEEEWKQTEGSRAKEKGPERATMFYKNRCS